MVQVVCFTLILMMIKIKDRVFKLDCPDGKLYKSKVEKMYKLILPRDGAALVDHIFRVFDKDRSGYIDFRVESQVIYQLRVA